MPPDLTGASRGRWHGPPPWPSRLRSGSLIAPALAHWTADGRGVIVALVA